MPEQEDNEAEEKQAVEKGAAEKVAAEEEAPSVMLIKNQLRIVGAITLDWPLMAEFFEPTNLTSNVELMVAQNRVSKALELLEIEPSFSARHEWMEATLKELKEAKEKMSKRSSRRRDSEFEQLTKLIEEKSRLASSVAGIMEQRGMDDEAQLYYQMIYAADKSSANNSPAEILDQLIQLGRVDDYWQLVASILRDPNQLTYMGRTWYGIQSADVKSLAVSWAQRIRGAIVDPLEQTKTIAAVMNSPWVNREELNFDLDFEIARFRSRSELNATGLDEYMLAQVLELNGQDQAASQMLRQAAVLGYQGAIQRSYQQAIASEDDRGILKYWIDAYRPTDTCLIAERSALKLLESETDPDQIKSIKRQLKICRLAIAARRIGAKDRGGYSQPSEMDESHLAAFELKCLAYGVSGNLLDERRWHQQLGDALVSEKANQESQGGIELAKGMFDSLNNTAGPSMDFIWSYTSMRLNLALAQGMIQRGEYDQAADLLVRHVQFSPGDVSVGEATVKKLDEAGATEAADQVYQAVEKHFVESLEMYPESPFSRNNYAWLSATSNRDLEMARRHAMVAVRVRPNVEQYLDTLAEVEFLLGQPKKAFELSKRCVQLNPTRNYYREQKERFRKAMSAAE